MSSCQALQTGDEAFEQCHGSLLAVLEAGTDFRQRRRTAVHISSPIEPLGGGIAPIGGGAGPAAADEGLIDGPLQNPDAGLVTGVDGGGVEGLQFAQAQLEPRDRGAGLDAGERGRRGGRAAALASSFISSSPLAIQYNIKEIMLY
jgi:hypothetical protein